MPLELVPQYVEFGPIIKEMSGKGVSINTMASATGLCWRAVADILEYTRTGVLPDSKSRPTKASRVRGADRPSNPLYARHAKRIVELRRNELTFQEIADQIKKESGNSISMNTVRRGFDYVNRDQLTQDVKAGKRPDRGISHRT